MTLLFAQRSALNPPDTRDNLITGGVIPAKAGIQTRPHVQRPWIPAFAGMTQR
jgi:hypothetical protein